MSELMVTGIFIGSLFIVDILAILFVLMRSE